MLRPLRIQYPGAIYHLMNRGDQREAISHDGRECRLCLTTLGEACEKTGWQLHAWCITGNHFHLVSGLGRACRSGATRPRPYLSRQWNARRLHIGSAICVPPLTGPSSTIVDCDNFFTL